MINKVMKNKKNVEIKCNAQIEGYSVDPVTKKVTHVNLIGGEKMPCDLVVVCTGPQTPKHLWHHFGCVLPSISAQGYGFDFKVDPAHHLGVNILLLNSPYSMSQYAPGTQRMSAFVDWGCFDKPFVDEKRIAFLHRQLSYDMGMPIEEVKQSISKMRPGLRPVSPDEMIIVGPMKHFPNVIINTGYGPWGFYCFAGGKVVESLVENTGEAE